MKVWIIAATVSIVTAGTVVTAIETSLGEAAWGRTVAAPWHHDTGWYFTHPAERQQVLRWCVADTRNARTHADDCGNAVAASNPYWGR